MSDAALDCRVYRCQRQADLYLYLRVDLLPDTLPEALRRRTGVLTPVLDLELRPARKLARCDVMQVMSALRTKGFYLQLPPDGQVQGHLDDGD